MLDPQAVRHLGIDIGTTNTSLCYTRYNNGKMQFDVPTVARLGQSGVLRSILLLDQDGGVIAAGEDVFKDPAYLAHPERVHEEFKLQLGVDQSADRYVRLLAGQAADRALRTMSLKEFDGSATLTTVGVPAQWARREPERVSAMERAVAAAGLPNVAAVPEPVAAMYLHARLGDIAFEDRRQSWLVIDIGGGTTDLAVIETQPGGVQPTVLHTFGQTFGGRDFDRLLLQKVILAQYWEGTQPPPPVDRLHLIQFARDFKERFSERLSQGQQEHSQRAPIRGVLNPVKLSRTAFESPDLGAPLIDRFSVMLAKAFRQSDRSLRDIDRVILTGGSARWYFVREVADSFFGRSVCLISANPELTISQGLALARTNFTLPVRTVESVKALETHEMSLVATHNIDTLPIESIAIEPLDLGQCRREAENIIKKRAATAGAVGLLLSPIPGISQIPLTGIETEMVMKVSGVYGYKLTQQELMMVVGGLLAGGTIAKVAVMETLTFVPGVGWMLKGGVAGGAALAFGRLAIEYFERRRQSEQGESS